MITDSGRKFVLVEPMSSDHAALGVEFRRRLNAGVSFMCRECLSLKPTVREIGPIVVKNVIDDAPFGLVISGLGIARKEFLYALGDEVVQKYFYTGPVANESGRQLSNWVSYHTKYDSPVRGSAEAAAYHICPQCQRLAYFALGKPYLYPAPPEGIEVFGHSVDLIVTEDLARKLKDAAKLKSNWKRIKFTDLTVLEAPRDGLGEIDSYMRNSPSMYAR